MNRMPMSELVQECGCWALKEIARQDPYPASGTGWQAEIMQKGGIEIALLALNKHTKSFVVQYRGLQLLVCLAVRGIDDWMPHSATSKAPLHPGVVKAIRRGGGVRVGRDSLFVHSLGRVHDQGDGRETRYIRSEVQEYAWRLMVVCGEQDQYACAELASYYPSTFDDLPEPELQRKAKWIGKVVRDAIRDKKGLGYTDADGNDGEMNSIDALFRSIDGDGSGDLDYEEFCVAMDRLGLGLNGEEVKELISVLDVDGDGEISIEEFMTIVNEPE